jgi:hypothetical protein
MVHSISTGLLLLNVAISASGSISPNGTLGSQRLDRLAWCTALLCLDPFARYSPEQCLDPVVWRSHNLRLDHVQWCSPPQPVSLPVNGAHVSNGSIEWDGAHAFKVSIPQLGALQWNVSILFNVAIGLVASLSHDGASLNLKARTNGTGALTFQVSIVVSVAIGWFVSLSGFGALTFRRSIVHVGTHGLQHLTRASLVQLKWNGSIKHSDALSVSVSIVCRGALAGLVSITHYGALCVAASFHRLDDLDLPLPLSPPSSSPRPAIPRMEAPSASCTSRYWVLRRARGLSPYCGPVVAVGRGALVGRVDVPQQGCA